MPKATRCPRTSQTVNFDNRLPLQSGTPFQRSIPPRNRKYQSIGQKTHRLALWCTTICSEKAQARVKYRPNIPDTAPQTVKARPKILIPAFRNEVFKYRTMPSSIGVPRNTQKIT